MLALVDAVAADHTARVVHGVGLVIDAGGFAVLGTFMTTPVGVSATSHVNASRQRLISYVSVGALSTNY